MMELKVELDFACCTCDHSVSVTVQCTGGGLFSVNPVAAVKVPCPSCGQINQLCFETDGTVRAVCPYGGRFLIPEPSLN